MCLGQNVCQRVGRQNVDSGLGWDMGQPDGGSGVVGITCNTKSFQISSI